MTKNVQLLKEFIELAIEAWNPETKSFDTVTNSKSEEEKLTKDKFVNPRISRGASTKDWGETADSNFEDEIKQLRKDPEYKNLETFVSYKFDDEQSTYTAVELQALVRNVDFNDRRMFDALPPNQLINDVKEELSSYGLKLVPREKVKHFRGSMSSAHGSSPFAGTVGGGSGFMNGGYLGIGGGPGIISTGEKWDASSPRNLPMGSRRR
jgi:hypothetical protein